MMLTSLALMVLLGLLLSGLFRKLRLPGLIGLLLTGILLGPHMLDVLDGKLLDISAELRQIALIIILARAGLSLNLKELKAVGRPAVLMCFVPACFEIAGMMLLAPGLLGISLLDAAIMGAVVGAVSPAVIVPKMLTLMEQGYGKKRCIPQMILAGASVDDIFVIVLFTAFTGLAQGKSVTYDDFISIPVSILTGAAAGAALGLLLAWFFRHCHLRDTVKTVLLLAIAFLLTALETAVKPYVPISGLLAVMSMGIALRGSSRPVADRLSLKFSKLWVGAELFLFVLVGAAVDIGYVRRAGLSAVLLILLVLVFRMAGVLVCLMKTGFSGRERLFCMIAYLPKATVQAAIGGVPLAMGLSCGASVLTVAVLAILITAPLGAIGIDLSYRRCLNRER